MIGHTFSTAINQGFVRFGVLGVCQIDKSSIDPASGFDGVQAADNQVEGHVVIIVFVLNLAVIAVRKRGSADDDLCV